jgi:hypothetical protein
MYDDKIINTNNHTQNSAGNNLNNNYLNNNSKETKTIHTPKLNSKVPYLLRGLMRCSCCNSILTPTYTTKKNGIVYRYYKPSKLMKHTINNKTNKGCELVSIPAEQIENIVLNQIYGIIRTPAMIQKIIDDVLEKQKQINKEQLNKKQTNEEEINEEQTSNNVINLSEQDIINHLKNIETVWDELFPREQMEIVNLLIKEIIVSRTNIKIVFNNDGFVQLVQEASGIDLTSDSISNSSDILSDTTIVNISIDLTHKTGRSFITTPDGGSIVIENANVKRIAHGNYVDNAVLKELIQAEEWKEELNNNPNMNINTIAKREHKQNSYICRILDLVFLAPDIKKLILDGNAPVGLSLKEISNVIGKEWGEQREKLRIKS